MKINRKKIVSAELYIDQTVPYYYYVPERRGLFKSRPAGFKDYEGLGTFFTVEQAMKRDRYNVIGLEDEESPVYITYDPHVEIKMTNGDRHIKWFEHEQDAIDFYNEHFKDFLQI